MLPASKTPQREGYEMTCGLTKLSFYCMDQRISYVILGEMTQIPAALVSMYAIGRRPISRTHLPLLSLALGVAPKDLLGYCTDEEVFVDEDEWSDSNPYVIRGRHARKRTNILV